MNDPRPPTLRLTFTAFRRFVCDAFALWKEETTFRTLVPEVEEAPCFDRLIRLHKNTPLQREPGFYRRKELLPLPGELSAE